MLLLFGIVTSLASNDKEEAEMETHVEELLYGTHVEKPLGLELLAEGERGRKRGRTLGCSGGKDSVTKIFIDWGLIDVLYIVWACLMTRHKGNSPMYAQGLRARALIPGIHTRGTSLPALWSRSYRDVHGRCWPGLTRVCVWDGTASPRK